MRNSTWIKNQSNTLSLMYSGLMEDRELGESGFINKCERDMGVTFMAMQKKIVMYWAHKSSMSCKYQEIGYKLLTRWYCTPTRPHVMYPQVCWRCGEGEGTLLHVNIWEIVQDSIWKMSVFASFSTHAKE